MDLKRLLAKLRWNIGLLYYQEALDLEKHGTIIERRGAQPGSSSQDEHLLLQSYKGLTDIYNRRVLFGFDVFQNPLIEATVLGLDHTGALILELDDSSKVVQHSGEIIYLD